jgi:ligand-binding SRPBCC domain-containing protein
MKPERFLKQSIIAAPSELVFAFHENPEALSILTPPWERVTIVQPPSGLQVGAKVILEIELGPFKKRWIAEHTEYDPPRLFVDRQLEGPFQYWNHRHLFESINRGATLMTDEVEYILPMGVLGRLAAGWHVGRKLEKLFEYRHKVMAKRFSSYSPKL